MIEVFLAGTVDYQLAWDWQRARVEQVSRGEKPEALLLLQHPHVITLGRGSHDEHVLITAEEGFRRGVELVQVDRGGDVTYHGPGQLVGYPILRLSRRGNDARQYLRDLEEVIIRSLRDYSLEATRKEGYTGVWVKDEKIAAIGVKLSRFRESGFVTSHGFAINIHTDLSFFDLIVPCGIQEYGVTSMRTLGVVCTLEEFTSRLLEHFGEVFEQPLDVKQVTHLPI